MAKRPSNFVQQRQQRIRRGLICAFFGILAFMTVGFAAYGQILDFSGIVTLQPQGSVRITNVTFDSTNSKNATSTPTFTDTTIDFNLSFSTPWRQTEQDSYIAIYTVTIQNDTFYNQIFSANNYVPTISQNGQTLTNADINFALDGITNGDTIPEGESVTFSIIISFVPTSDETGTFTVDNDLEINFNSEQTGQLFASISASTTGDLRAPNTRAAFTVSVINTFDYSRDFTLALANSSSFYLADANGTQSPTFTIGAKSTQEYTVYVYPLDPTAQYSSSYVRANIFLQSSGLADINAGRITLLVDQEVIITDTEAPVVSNLLATRQNVDGEVLLTWSATDDSTINNFTIQVYSGSTTNGALVNTFTTTDDETSYTLTGLNDGDYYFVIYGTDAHGNTATNSEIAGASTSSSHATRTNSATFSWTYSITYSLSWVGSSNTATSIKIGQTYTTTLRAINQWLGQGQGGSTYPSSGDVSVTMSGRALTQNTDYTYNASTGALSVPNVTGNLVIGASSSGGCLIEGTKVSLWNGGYKNIEDIDYDDLLKVWSYDLGEFVPAYPIWIEREHTTDTYRLIEFSDGTVLNTVFAHSIFSSDLGRFVSVDDSEEFYVGTKVLKEQGGKLVSVEVTKNEIVEKSARYYNVISTYYFNVLTNNLLTSATADDDSTISNLYGFTEDLRWPDSRQVVLQTPSALYQPSQLPSVPRYIFQGFRVQEAAVFSDYYSASELEDIINNALLSSDMQKPQTLKPFGVEELGGTRYWYYNLDGKAKLVKEGSTQIIPAGTWFNTADGQTYHGGDQLEIWTSVYLIKL